MNKYSVFALVTLGLTFILINLIDLRGVPTVVRTNLENIPLQIGPYTGKEEFFSKNVYDALHADCHVYRHYHSPDDGSVTLYVGYYGTAKGGRTGHNPFACLPASGWGIREKGTILLKPSYQPEGVLLNYILSEKGGVYNIVIHWYQSSGTKVLATGLQQNIQKFLGKVFRNRDDGAYVQISSLGNEGEIENKLDLIKSFSLHLLEFLPAYWPEEV